MRRSRWAGGVCGMATAFAVGSAWATSIFVEGVITDVKPDLTGYSVYAYDHYNHVRFQDRITNMPVKIAGNAVFVLDTMVLKREAVLAPGRSMYAIGSSAGAMLNVAISEPAARIVGEVVSAGAGAAALKVHIGADAFTTNIAVAADAVGRDALTPGATVRVTPARAQTVLAFSPSMFESPAPAGTPLAVDGVLKQLAPDWTLAVVTNGAIGEVRVQAKNLPVCYDARGFVGHGTPDLSGVGVGAPAAAVAYAKRPGKIDSYLVVQAPDGGRIIGTVRAVDAGARTVTLDVLAVDGVKSATVTLDADAAVTLDGKPASIGDALKPGHRVMVYAERKQRFEALAQPAAEPAH